MDFARRFVNADNDWNNRSLAQLSLQYTYSDLFAATDGFHEKNKIGTGSYGAVYRGVMSDGTEVAIKVIDLPSEAGFEDEVRVLSKFRHPNLVILMGFAVNGTQRLLVYECLSGGDVSRRLQKCARDGSPFSAQQRLSVALDAACGLSHLHNANPKVYHRDIKTANILLDRNGGAKMADFGLACLSRSSEHKVKQASGTIGYACPYYIQRGVVTEGSEVYSFGMVLIELLCNAPPACSGSSPGEILYLVNHLQGSVSKCVAMADPRGNWSSSLATRLAELAMNCVSMTETTRPKFVQIVKQLRTLHELASGVTVNSSMTNESPVRPPPMSPAAAKKTTAAAASSSPTVELVRLECVVAPKLGDLRTIVHACSLEESNQSSSALPPLKVGRHCQASLFDALVPVETLKGTISREHFTISFQAVTRSVERQFHATVTNNSINSISVNGEKVLEKGQSSFVYSGDVLAFLALQPPTSVGSPTPFLAFKLEILLTPLIQAVRPKPVAGDVSAHLGRSASTASLPEIVLANSSQENSLNVSNAGRLDRSGNFEEPFGKIEKIGKVFNSEKSEKFEKSDFFSKSEKIDKIPLLGSIPQNPVELVRVVEAPPLEVVPRPVSVGSVPTAQVVVAPAGPSFWLQVKRQNPSRSNLSEDIFPVLSVRDPSAALRVGRSFQPESFWRSLAPDACPAISREHFSVSCMRDLKTGPWRFLLTCSSMNGLAVLLPGSCPVFIQKDTPGAGAFEIFEGTEIELAGSIRLVFRERLNVEDSTAAQSCTGSMGELGEEFDFPNDAFAQTGFQKKR